MGFSERATKLGVLAMAPHSRDQSLGNGSLPRPGRQGPKLKARGSELKVQGWAGWMISTDGCKKAGKLKWTQIFQKLSIKTSSLNQKGIFIMIEGICLNQGLLEDFGVLF